MENFIYDYFVSPIWDRTGYNIVNTLVYAGIAIAAIFALHKALKGRVKIDDGFVNGVLSFVLFASTMRVVTDAIDHGKFLPLTPFHQFVLDSHLWDYGYLTVTPGIYILTAALLLATAAILHRLKRMDMLPYIGLALWLPHFLLLLPLMAYGVFALPILLLAAIPAYIAMMYFKDRNFALIVAGQAFDGAATFFVIDVFGPMLGVQYFEQHVLGSAIGELFGTYFAFYLVKVAIAFAAAYVLQKEKMDEEDRRFVALVLMIMGFAPGIRDVLRMVVAT
ncbi:MAG: DUF63 family protein [Candidatus Micrarchaeota archaeon]